MSFFALPVSAEEAATEIYTPQDLLAIAQNPGGSYILMADLDMTGVDWPCPAFSGQLDGNGFAILNLTIGQPGALMETAYDGNMKPYETQFAGLFSVMRNATVKNLTLLNTRIHITTDQPCFVGTLAGMAWDCTIENCTVQSQVELRAHKGMFGVAGLVGYGSGTVAQCDLDVTLICTDTGVDTLDEQFMGGILANGFMDIKKCNVKLDGYSSEYGYAHNGGLVGMYFQKPFDPEAEHHGRIINNAIDGKITFFECNSDRRAYCKAIVGEPVAHRWGEDYNKQNFKRDERREYDKELRPEMCTAPQYQQTVQAPGCETFGYTQHTCATCGYTYTDSYRLKSHSFGPWEVVTEPSAQADGQSRAVCTACGAETYRVDTYVPPVTEPPAEDPQPQQPQATQQEEEPHEQKDEPRQTDWVLVILVVIVLAAAIAVACLCWKEHQRKRRRKRRRPNRPPA